MLPIMEVLKSATSEQLRAARSWAADNLHAPDGDVSDTVAVSYVQRHFRKGGLEGWEGFVEDIFGPAYPMNLAGHVEMSSAHPHIAHVEGPYFKWGTWLSVVWLKGNSHGVCLARTYPTGTFLVVVRRTGDWTAQTGTPFERAESNPVVPGGREDGVSIARIQEVIRDLASHGAS